MLRAGSLFAHWKNRHVMAAGWRAPLAHIVGNVDEELSALHTGGILLLHAGVEVFFRGVRDVDARSVCGEEGVEVPAADAAGYARPRC